MRLYLSKLPVDILLAGAKPKREKSERWVGPNGRQSIFVSNEYEVLEYHKAARTAALRWMGTRV